MKLVLLLLFTTASAITLQQSETIEGSVIAPGDCSCRTTKSGIKICTKEGNDSWAGESCE